MPDDILWQLVVALFGVLDTLLTGIMIWIICNQSELFRRLRQVEADNQTAAAVCDERHTNHPRRRVGE